MVKKNNGTKIPKLYGPLPMLFSIYKHLSMNSEYKHLRKGNFNTKV